ncbi:PREDICTED: DNA repair protein RAD51 homolog 4 [Cyphomyrmex costatus]|uniref:DNA repair protein RAD51 like protein 4 n=1 Tax=Cyphomyrmex costatus TaxID=456900 RepID=A0A195C474_9HYME|nr:PREDICTED: DNA repair protein RAD51 homolog 4 [Cyphomyrmex costatus]XP_018403293.1 PREDICTED: DNA repair protein RAD51 homolog 4 [Cyphomyrmex costatus]KYM95654.1 DNA repair protein RAD51 like protein 4 [Cyphomyrmex costatus]
MIKLNADVHPSLSETMTENLRRRNVVTMVDFVSTDPIKLTNIIGLSHTDVLQVKQHILKKFGGIKKNATQLLAIERDVISTSITCLDELLRGGLYPGQLCELCGPSASGKTQLCFTIAANVASRSDGIVWYFDTKRDFCRMRYEGIMRARNFEQKIIDDALRSTKIYQAHSSNELIQGLRQLVTLCEQEQNEASLKERKVLLVIIDSLPAIIFKVTRNAQQSDNETTYELEDLAEICRFLTMKYQAVVITVNLITRWISPGQTDSADITPALGKCWARIPTTRLLITRLYGEIRKINVWKDLRLIENSSCTVIINDIGVTS